MAETLRRGREVAVQLVKEDPSSPPDDLSWEGMTPEEAAAENERQTGAITARKLDCKVGPRGRDRSRDHAQSQLFRLL